MMINASRGDDANTVFPSWVGGKLAPISAIDGLHSPVSKSSSEGVPSTLPNLLALKEKVGRRAGIMSAAQCGCALQPEANERNLRLIIYIVFQLLNFNASFELIKLSV